MEAVLEPDWATTGILGAARGARETDGAVGTQHLLAAVTATRGSARAALADEGVTKTAVFAVLRNTQGRQDAWSGAETTDSSVPSRDVLGRYGAERTSYTGAAARALTAAMETARQEGATKLSPVHLLRALLREDTHAAELLTACGVTPQSVRDRLDGGTGTAADSLDPLLRPTRDALLGRAPYRHMPFGQRWLTKLAGINWASRPVSWVRWEAPEQARRRGDTTVGTEHVLLALLATHEVAQRHPHLTRAGGPDLSRPYAGGERLARQGLTYATVHHALQTGALTLPTDPHLAQHYLDAAAHTTATSTPSGAFRSRRTPPPDPGTGPLLDALLHDETRAHHLVTHLTGNS